MFTPPNRSAQSLVFCALAVAVLVAVDLGSKAWVVDALSIERPGAGEACERAASGAISMQRAPKGAVVLIDKYLEFRYAENCGAAFGMLRNMPTAARKGVFYLAASAAIFFLMWMYVTGRGGRLFAVAVPLIVAGAVGNLVDRFQLGYVVDFIRFHLDERWSYPTFNAADVWITVGVVLVLLDGFVHKPDEAMGSGS